MPPCAGHIFPPPAAARRTLWVTLVVMATAAATCSASLSPCAHGRFFSSDTQTCRTCSPCPRNQIIRRPCGHHSDTLCGPFSEFFRFHQAPRLRLQVADLPLPEEGGGRAGGGRRGGQGHERDIHGDSRLPEQTRGVWQDRSPKKKTQGQRHREHDVIREGVEVKVVPDVSRPWTGQDRGGEERSRVAGDGGRRQQQDPGPRLQQDPGPRLHSPDGDESGWKVLALALIIVLCVVCVVLISFISVLCYLRSRRALKSFCPAGKYPSDWLVTYVWPPREFLPLNVSTPACSTPCRRTDFGVFYLKKKKITSIAKGDIALNVVCLKK